MKLEIHNLFDGLDEETKICSKCNQNLPLHNYSKASGGKYLRSECSDCSKSLNIVRDRIKRTALPPPKDYVCPVCKQPEEKLLGTGGKKSGVWCCDHDHVTEKFRGWLCHNCNRGIGTFKDDIDLLESAKQYLEKSKYEIQK